MMQRDKTRLQIGALANLRDATDSESVREVQPGGTIFNEEYRKRSAALVR